MTIDNPITSGIITPMITSFDRSDGINSKAIKEVALFLKTRVNGLFLNGTYGSGLLMNISERQAVSEIVVEEVNNNLPIFINISSSNYKDSIELGKHAEKIEASGVVATIPLYYKYEESLLEEYFLLLKNKLEVPIYFYNNPSITGYTATAVFLNKLAKIGIRGIKDSCTDIIGFTNYINALSDYKNFEFITGTEALMLPAVLLGACACVSGMSNFLPDEVVNLWKEIKEGSISEAAKLQREIIEIRNVLKKFPTIPIIHRALMSKGINAGYPRTPFSETSEQEWEIALESLKQTGAI